MALNFDIELPGSEHFGPHDGLGEYSQMFSPTIPSIADCLFPTHQEELATNVPLQSDPNVVTNTSEHIAIEDGYTEKPTQLGNLAFGFQDPASDSSVLSHADSGTTIEYDPLPEVTESGPILESIQPALGFELFPNLTQSPPNIAAPQAASEQRSKYDGTTDIVNPPLRFSSDDSTGVETDTPRGPQAIKNKRRSRSRAYPDLSDEWKVYESTADCTDYGAVIDIGQAPWIGMNSGRNLMAIFKNLGAEPRTIYQMKIDRGRNQNHFEGPHWCTVKPRDQGDRDRIPIPAGITLEKICQYYPLHVWGSGLRIFISEGWDERKIWESLPKENRHHNQGSRPWNYLQAIVGRETERMWEEDGNPPREKKLRKKRSHNEYDEGQNSRTQNPAKAVVDVDSKFDNNIDEGSF